MTDERLMESFADSVKAIADLGAAQNRWLKSIEIRLADAHRRINALEQPATVAPDADLHPVALRDAAWRMIQQSYGDHIQAHNVSQSIVDLYQQRAAEVIRAYFAEMAK